MVGFGKTCKLVLFASKIQYDNNHILLFVVIYIFLTREKIKLENNIIE